MILRDGLESFCFFRCQTVAYSQLKMIPIGFQKPFFLQPGKLRRHCRAVNAKVVCQLLPVKGNIEGEGRMSGGLCRQVRQQFVPCRSLANMGDFIVKNQDFIGQHADQVADQLLVVLAGRLAGEQQPLNV